MDFFCKNLTKLKSFIYNIMKKKSEKHLMPIKKYHELDSLLQIYIIYLI